MRKATVEEVEALNLVRREAQNLMSKPQSNWKAQVNQLYNLGIPLEEIYQNNYVPLPKKYYRREPETKIEIAPIKVSRNIAKARVLLLVLNMVFWILLVLGLLNFYLEG